MFNRNKNDKGEPENLWIDINGIRLTMEDTTEGEGALYIHSDLHVKMINELIDKSNQDDQTIRNLKRANKELVEQAMVK